MGENEMDDELLREHEELYVGDDALFDLRQLGNLLKSYMTRRDVHTIQKLLDKVEDVTGCKWHENTYGNFLNGRREPSLTFLVAVMLTLNIPFSDLEECVAEKHREQFRALVR
jgi:hypothetical protein